MNNCLIIKDNGNGWKNFIEDGCQLTEDNCCCYENSENKYEFDEKGNIVGYKVKL